MMPIGELVNCDPDGMFGKKWCMVKGCPIYAGDDPNGPVRWGRGLEISG